MPQECAPKLCPTQWNDLIFNPLSQSLNNVLPNILDIFEILIITAIYVPTE